MVSEEGKKWLEGLDRESVKRREAQGALDRKFAEAQAIENKKNREYKEALPKVIEDLRHKSSNISRIGSGTMSDTAKQRLHLVEEQGHNTISAIAAFEAVVDELLGVTSEIADENDSTTLREAVDLFTGSKTSLSEAITHIQEAVSKVEDYIRTLST